MQKLQWYSLQELEKAPDQLMMVKCLGKVLQIVKMKNFYNFVISDGKFQAEVTLYEHDQLYSTLELPSINNLVIVVGKLKKVLLNKTIIKIKLKLFRIITQDKAIKLKNKIAQIQKLRKSSQKNVLNQSSLNKKRRSIQKQLKAVVDPVQLRSLILSCVYVTLQNNPDLKSYTFSLCTIQKHRLTKSFIQSKKLKQQSIECLCKFIDPEMKYLVQRQMIQEKDTIDGQKIFVAYKKVFQLMQQKTLGIIRENHQKGTILSEIVFSLNNQKGIVQQKNYIINDSLVQRIIKKYIQANFIYKTTEKVLYPNSQLMTILNIQR